MANLIVEDKNGNRVISTNIPSAYIGRVGIEGRASLVIENITIQDNTLFQCTLRPEPATGDLDKVSVVKLIVTGMVLLLINLTTPNPTFVTCQFFKACFV